MSAEILSPGRAGTLRKLLLVDLGLAALIALIGALFIAGGDARAGATLVVIAVVLGGLGWVTLRAVDRRTPGAHRLVLATGTVLILCSVPLIGILVGLLTVIAGIGLLAILYAPERESR